MESPAERCGWSMGAGIAGRGLVSNRSCYRCLGRFAKILGRNDGDFDFDFEVRGYSRWCIGESIQFARLKSWACIVRVRIPSASPSQGIMISRHRLRIMDQIPFDIVYGIKVGNERRYRRTVNVNEGQARKLCIIPSRSYKSSRPSRRCNDEEFGQVCHEYLIFSLHGMTLALYPMSRARVVIEVGVLEGWKRETL